jgi:hypothetical protein
VPPVPAPSPRRCLLLFTKPARPGYVKTRLTRGPGALTPRQAAELHAAFLGDLAARLLPATGRGEMRLRVAWALEDGEPLPDLLATVAPVGELAAPPGAALDAVRQEGADLGARLFHALAAAAQTHPGGVAAVGSDHPTLPLGRVRRAFHLLADGSDVVLGPADDGGYYLIALRRAALRRRLFEDVPWSTGGVLAATEARCRELGLRLARLPEGRDVDDPPDLDRLAARLATGGAEPASGPAPVRAGATGGEAVDCPRTRRLLAAWGRLPPAAVPVAPALAGETVGKDGP